MLFKSCPSKVKAAGEQDGLKDGEFEAIVSVFGNVDSYGDVVMPGAFAKTLEEWAAQGDPIPIYYSHRMDDPDFNIGHVLEAKEIKEGLWIKGLIDLEDPLPGSKAPQVHRLLKGRRVTQFSFAYDISKAEWAKTKNADGEDVEVYELHELKLHEVGPTPIGANQSTTLLGVKSAGEHARQLAAEVKAGRVLSSKNENVLREAAQSLKDASSHITDVLAQLGDSESGKSTSSGATPAPKTSGVTPSVRGVGTVEAANLLEILTAG